MDENLTKHLYEKGNDVKRHWIEISGGFLTEDQMSFILDISIEDLNSLRLENKLIALSEQNEWMYPRFQVKGNKIVPGLIEVLCLFAQTEISDWDILGFFVKELDYLRSNLAEYPLAKDAILAGHVDEVVTAARQYLSHSAA